MSDGPKLENLNLKPAPTGEPIPVWPPDFTSRAEPGVWEPIETAPRDGTLIDLWLDGERAPACRYQDYPGNTHPWEQAYAEATDCFFPLYDAEPTHWMPIPEPPEDWRSEMIHLGI